MGENAETTRKVVESLYRADFAAGRDAFEPSVEYAPIRQWPESSTRYGVDALFAFIESVIAEWELWEGEVRDIRESGDKVLVETRIRGVGEKSGIDLKGRLFHVYTFAGGKIVKIEDFLAKSEAYRAAGLAT